MASNYKHLVCPTCAGTVKYVKEKKVWECIYCGNEMRREEEYDGLYTIKNVVKQVLLDLANDRFDSAGKNLVECQKISSDYVGTLIANICLKVFLLNTSDVYGQNEKRAVLGQIRRLYNKFCEISGGEISADEEGLYEAFNDDDNSEAFGVLVIVFDILQATVHLDFVLNLFDAAHVYSTSLNERLLNYALRNDKREIVDKIFMNSDNLNCRDAFITCLNLYEDSDQKQKCLPPIMEKAEFKSEDYKEIETYLTNTQDSLETKIIVYKKAADYRIAPPMQCVVEHILNHTRISEAQISDIYKSFCATKPKDSELYELITDIYTKHSGKTACIEMQELLNNNIFIRISDKIVKFMITRKDLSVEDRITLLEKAEQCNLNAKENDSILSEILLRDQESYENRLLLLRKMMEYVDTISTGSLTEYIVISVIDGDKKADVLQELFKLDLNMSYFRDVLNNYMRSSKDSAETKRAVAQILSGQGIGVDSDRILEMACAAREDNYIDTAHFIQQSINNNTRIHADCLSQYMERVSPQNYHSEIMSLLTMPMSKVSDKALANYVLYAEAPVEIKLQNAIVFAEKNGKIFGESECEIKHLNNTVKCNLYQGYVLISDDSLVTVEAIIGAMKTARARLNPSIYVNGKCLKFKKYISDNKMQLSQITLTLCEENNVFSFFF